MEQQRSSSSRAIAATVILPLVAVAFATAIFAIDTFTPLGLAVAVLYALVASMASSAGSCSAASRCAMKLAA